MISGDEDAQAIVSTHSPSVVKRVPPEQIRYLKLNAKRATVVNTIQMPAKTDEAHKFVREAVQAYPELYFSRLVILGEGDSEEVVIPRLLEAGGIGDDESSIVVVPLGGRHVNHFWRLLNALGIPHVTLLDLDLGRHQGGWGRVKYAANQLLLYLPSTARSPLQASAASLRGMACPGCWSRVRIGRSGNHGWKDTASSFRHPSIWTLPC